MKIGIMQPYFFPYIGYYQIVHAVDKFVFYDDVNFIKQGWINRNRIISNDRVYLFSVPLEKVSSYKRINETRIHKSSYVKWLSKFSKTIEQTYKKAPYFATAYPLIVNVLSEDYDYVSQLCVRSVVEVTRYLQVDAATQMSTVYKNNHLKAQDRVLDICLKENGTVYINPIGGTRLYDKADFKNVNVDLYFLKTKVTEYAQFKGTFLPALSIIDVLMFNAAETVRKMLDEYDLL